MEQIKVLIVDDEYLIRNLIRKRINWEEQGMTIVGEASDAHEALNMVDTLRPDIVFTDICMPFIDGIEFSRMVTEKHPAIKIVIITGHDEFEFARRSIKLGIADFILKPIHAAELLNVTERLKKKIQEERTRKQEFEKLKEELRQSLPFLREKFLNRWILQRLSASEILEEQSFFNLPFTEGNLLRIAVLELSLTTPEQTQEQNLLLSMDGRKRVEAFFSGSPESVVFMDNKNQIVVITDVRGRDVAVDCELLKKDLIHSLKCFVCIGVGNRHSSLRDIPIGYREACRALNYKTFVGKNQVVCYEDVVESGEQQYRSNPELLEELHFYISAGAAEKAAAVLKEILRFPFSEVSQMRLAAMDIIAQCQNIEAEQKINGGDTLNKDTLAAVLLSDNLPDIQKKLEAHIAALSGSINAKNSTKAGYLIERVKDFLNKNLSSPDLSLVNTAAAFFVSPGHLGRLFKKATGQTFVEYLTDIRIKRAEILLKTTELKGYQVGDEVGIADPHYFCILFKKKTGKSVNEYRKGTKCNA
ncbi:two-component system response regulator [Clostridium sp. W14A]|uniref:Stage 0 sporulation protein A homolog n=1 Tax=Caproicibacter fermentans TaxID=2576756 RepID=A0A7G8T817_9FIRM|nr:response regulator [Caproicibacter fermentans]OCN02637.1 two-component system response regulator [Clostridium sp. W14A]QNK39758.1 response regulator [Caproicibacter fermentans]